MQSEFSTFLGRCLETIARPAPEWLSPKFQPFQPFQPASFTIQAYYIKINELRTAPRFHIASSRGHELSNGFSHHRALRQIRRVFGGAEEPRSRLRICGPSVCFTRGRPPRAHSNVPLYFHDSRFERYLYSGDLGGMLVTISSG